MAKLTKEEIIRIADEKGIEIIDPDSYVRLSEDMEVRCKAKGHRFWASVEAMRLNSFYCPACERQEAVYVGKPPKKSGYRIMGWDQATQHFGVSIFDDGKLVYFDCIDFIGDTETRFVKIMKFIENMIIHWEPDFVCFEDIQLQTNGANASQFQTFKVLAQLMGIVKAMLMKYEIEHSCVLNKVWQAQFSISGSDRSTQKRNVINKVKALYGVTVTDDVADAILIGRYAVMKKTPPKPIASLF